MADNRPDPKIMGVINLTPDSFSHIGEPISIEEGLTLAQKMVHDGANIIDIGGDSSRPGSLCVSEEEEMRRIQPFLKKFNGEFTLSIDTHRASVAFMAIEEGAKIINDISAGADSGMFRLIANTDVKIVLMHSICPRPHEFPENLVRDNQNIVAGVTDFLKARIELALSSGVRESQIILDPGLGRFLSPDPEDSWALLGDLGALYDLGFPVLIGASRKGFLRAADEVAVEDRDILSAQVASAVAVAAPADQQLYIRAHHVALHRKMLDVALRLSLPKGRAP